MKKHLFIDLLYAGLISSTLLVGCGKTNTQYCSAGMQMISERNYDGAFAEFNSEISKNSNNRDAYRGLGIVYYNRGDYVNAANQFKTVIDKSGDKYDDINQDALKYYADCLMKTEDYNGAIEYYTILLGKCNKSEKADFYYFRGCAYIKIKDENNGALDFEKSLEYKSDEYTIYCNMYNAFMEAGYKDRAESYLKRLINADDADDFLIGKTYFIFKDYENAERKLEASVDGGNTDAIFYLAMTYEAEGRISEAEELYKSYIGKKPEDANIYNQYGTFLMNRENYDDALTYFDKGLALTENSDLDRTKQVLLYNQAICYELKGDFTKAYSLFETYMKDYPNDSKANREYIFLKSRQ